MTEPIDDEPVTEVVSEIGPWAMVPAWVLSKGLAPAELAVYISLRSFADRQGGAHPKARTIASRAMVAIGTARNAIQSLRDKKLISTEEMRRPDGSLAGLTYRMRDIDPTPGYVPEEKKPRGVRGKGSRTPAIDEAATPAPSGVHPIPDETTHPSTPSGAEGCTPSGAGVDTKWCSQEQHTKRTHQVGTPSVPPTEVRRSDDDDVQPTLTGEVAQPSERDSHNLAMGIARRWIDKWEEPQPDGTKLRILMHSRKGNPQQAIANAIKFALREGVPEIEITRAMAWVNMDIPEAQQLRRGLTQVQRGWKPGPDWLPGKPHSAAGNGRQRNGAGPMAGTNLHVDDLSVAERAARNPFTNVVRSSEAVVSA